ncbi:ethyl tert-butyl ether degradation EthD [Colletotrichum truncatum]|uniref:Ethyl tert-butyl ether degradation EthD n=1 Tax=Colletotrichum truncatum TaxID=5467 RepID=A0ACC3Z1X9_COLTU|nr:ethyl tert-butyl ether degradation EthD [Colletotrichum truncatum]KAF6781371.1 ethyl tert-butyl ether degradation EthD [Colletotrichum truncatum]
MSVAITVLFRNEPDAEHDIEYYVNNHMPLIQKQWEKYGVQGWSVTKFSNGIDGSAPMFAFGSTVTWGNQEQIKAAFEGPEAAEIMGDVSKFSNTQPVFLVGEVIRKEGI